MCWYLEASGLEASAKRLGFIFGVFVRRFSFGFAFKHLGMTALRGWMFVALHGRLCSLRGTDSEAVGLAVKGSWM